MTAHRNSSKICCIFQIRRLLLFDFVRWSVKVVRLEKYKHSVLCNGTSYHAPITAFICACRCLPYMSQLSLLLSRTYRMEGRILLFRSTAIPWSFCSLLKICVFSFDDRLTVEYRLPLLRAVVGACCFTELRSIGQERLRAAIASWCAGDRRTFSV